MFPVTGSLLLPLSKPFFLLPAWRTLRNGFSLSLVRHSPWLCCWLQERTVIILPLHLLFNLFPNPPLLPVAPEGKSKMSHSPWQELAILVLSLSRVPAQGPGAPVLFTTPSLCCAPTTGNADTPHFPLLWRGVNRVFTLLNKLLCCGTLSARWSEQCAISASFYH